MVEIAQAYAWITSEMQADSVLMAAATGGISQGFAPDDGTLPPYVAFNRQAGSDVLTMQAVRLYSSLLLQIKAIGPASNYDALETIAGRIDALFGDRRNVALPTGGGVLGSYREQPVDYDEPVNGQAWSHLGGLYRIELKAA